MFSSDTATVANSIGRLLPDNLQREMDATVVSPEDQERMSVSSSSPDADSSLPTVPEEVSAPNAVHLAQSAQNAESINFLKNRLAQKPLLSQALPPIDSKWQPSILAAPRGVRPLDLDNEIESSGAAQIHRLGPPSISTLRDTSSPEVETDISRTSSTSTRDSSLGSTDSGPASHGDLRLAAQNDASSTRLAPSIVLESELSNKDRTQSNETAAANSRMNAKRLHSIMELLDTERNYMEDLDLLSNVYFTQLRLLPYFSENSQRFHTVVRNIDQILALHQELTAKLTEIIQRATNSDASQDSADNAVIESAKLFVNLAPRFHVYNQFCARHKEALSHIDTAESRTSDWEVFRQRSAEAADRYLAQKNREARQGMHPTTSRGVMQRRLLFRDFFIKPIQRVCLYPIILQTIQKNSPKIGQEELGHAIDCMREVTLDVDIASKQRESALLTEMIGSRLEYTTSLSSSLYTSLGECKMSGTLDVLHHHNLYAPLTTPLPIKYYGCFLFSDFLLIVKVRRNHTFTPRYWFPLSKARLERNSAHQTYLRNSFRLAVEGHFFEFIASTAKEYQLWLNSLEEVFQRGPSSTRTLNGREIAYPCNLPVGPNSGSSQSGDPLVKFFAHRTQSNDSHTLRGRSSVEPAQSEILLRHKSPPRRAAMDRGMLFSDACISARTSFDNEGSLTLNTHPSSSTLGSTMGAIVNLSRLMGSETVSLRIPSRMASEDDITPTQTPQSQTPYVLSNTVTPIDSPTGTAPTSPVKSMFFLPDESLDSNSRGFRRRMRDSFSRKNSVQLDASEISAMRDTNASGQSLSRPASRGTLVHPSMEVNELGQNVAKKLSLSIDTSPAVSRPGSPMSSQSTSRVMRSPKAWFSSRSSRSSIDLDEGDPWPVPEAAPSNTLKRSNSLNWSNLRARNWSSTSLKSLVSRRSSDELDRDLPERPAPESVSSQDSVLNLSRPASAASTHGDSITISPTTAANPKRKFAMRFLQRNRLSPMAPIDPTASSIPQ
ncbi:hypothetical protein MPSI1_000364 [Malassezia psittaci]|uniref:DH domain-containing protein n=1 Tax=Malassezia psittaci TaxID=1821823 RepID=A0AAF0JCK4_9BASI|nr:hypothetical protein MPSI1_000364 [Malassezia psittaci]